MSEDRPDRCQRPVACLGCVGRAYEAVVLPVRSRRGETPYVMERIDLRSLLTAGRALHERVEDALSSRVFRNVTVDKLISLAGVGAERPVVSCADLVDAFFSYYEFTKIWERRVIAEAVSRAVMEERGGVRGRSRPHRPPPRRRRYSCGAGAAPPALPMTATSAPAADGRGLGGDAPILRRRAAGGRRAVVPVRRWPRGVR